jgi:hypothetical protein
MPRITPIDNEKFPRVNTRITREALERLNYACEVRERTEPRICPQGTILTELLMKHLEPTPAQRSAARRRRAPVRSL